jgi:hypothetical protein
MLVSITKWRKSTKSNPSGNCLEVAYKKSSLSVDGSCVEAAYKKSSLSAASACVEVAKPDAVVFVRDSQNPNGPHLEFNAPEWAAFLGGVGLGEFDLPVNA